jgi:hypothetical protein
MSRLLGLSAGYRFARALALGLALVAAATSEWNGGAVSAQSSNACTLLNMDEIQALASDDLISDGAAIAIQPPDFSSCRYTWGAGAGRYTLAVSINSASRMFAGMSGDSIERSLLSPVVPETSDVAIPDVGEAAIFKAYSSVYVTASTYLKDRILQVNLEGVDAREKKEQLIALLRAAASRL